jgi:DNA polymerase III subunit delta'
MKFASIPGLAYEKKLLIDAVNNSHTAHAQLFAGPLGALNLPMALAYTTYLHCENKGDDDACGVCSACVKNLKYIHPDTHFVFPLSNIKGDKDEERFKAEILKSWRAFLLEQPFGNLDDWTNYYGGEDKLALISREESREIIKTLALKPFESPNKVMIIWQPELMHPSAANGILKLLEEPPPRTYFILVTNAGDKLLPTIISRTQRVNIPLLPDDIIESHIKAHYPEHAPKAAKITQLADGDINLAAKLLDNEEDDNAQRFIEWMRECYNFKKNTNREINPAQALLARAEEFHALDKLNQRNLFVYSMSTLREILLMLNGAKTINRIRGEELESIQRLSKVLNNLEKVEKSFRLINDASYHLERNGSAKMIFFDLSLQLAKTINP